MADREELLIKGGLNPSKHLQNITLKYKVCLLPSQGGLSISLMLPHRPKNADLTSLCAGQHIDYISMPTTIKSSHKSRACCRSVSSCTCHGKTMPVFRNG